MRWISLSKAVCHPHNLFAVTVDLFSVSLVLQARFISPLTFDLINNSSFSTTTALVCKHAPSVWLWQTGTWPEWLSPRRTPSSLRYSSEQNRPSLQNPELVVAASCGGRGRGAKVTHVSGNRRPRQRPSGSHTSVARKAAARVCLLVTAFVRVVLPSGDWMRILHKLFHNHFISFPTVKASLLSL